MRRHAKRFLVAPRDPRMRQVVKSERLTGRGGSLVLELACGHIERRRLFHVPHSIICTQCPAEGGIGGRGFQR